jgi:DNA processing protein
MDENFLKKIKELKIVDEEYPVLLKKIFNPPSSLYIKGKLIKNEPCVAIVGARNCSDYGKEIAFSIAKNLARAGITIVSGMARGIDSFAHQGALEGGGRTIAVLGTGIDEQSIYPRENIGLSRKIIEKGGCLISEYPIGTKGLRQNFPERNRIIAGLCLGVLVVEAKIKSGALITARLAKIQKKEIFAVPGSIHLLNSKGPHFLIKKGANLVEGANDILKKLNFKKRKGEKIIGENAEQFLILKSLAQGGLSIDKIIESTKLPAQIVSANLALMEIEEKIKNLGANVFVLKK